MGIVNYSYARQNLAELMNEVERDCTAVFITRQRKRGGAVLVSQAEWDSIQETLYLLSNPKNAKALRDSIAELNAGKGLKHDLVEPAKVASSKRRVRDRSK